jgi:hypothetical protein
MPPTSEIPTFASLDEWQQLLAFARMTNDQRLALRFALIDCGREVAYGRAASAFDICAPNVQIPHTYLRRKLDLFSHYETMFGILDPASELAAVEASKEVE